MNYTNEDTKSFNGLHIEQQTAKHRYKEKMPYRRHGEMNKKRRRKLNQHVKKMTNDRMAHITLNNTLHKKDSLEGFQDDGSKSCNQHRRSCCKETGFKKAKQNKKLQDMVGRKDI